MRFNVSSWSVGTGAADTAPRSQNRYNNTSLTLTLWMQHSRNGLWHTTLLSKAPLHGRFMCPFIKLARFSVDKDIRIHVSR